MAHELTIRDNGMAEMAYIGERPWHDLGQELPEGATIAEWTQAAGYDWEIRRSPVLFDVNAGGLRRYAGRDVLYRSDSGDDLSIVSPQFKIVQPRDVLSYFQDLIDKAGFNLSTAGTLFGGRQFWALADINTDYVADPNDHIKGQLLLTTGVDLSTPTIAKFVATRVVCWNTLSWGMAERGGSLVRVRHDRPFDPKLVNAELGIGARSHFTEIVADFRKLAETAMSDEEKVILTLRTVAPKSADLDEMELDDLIKLCNSRRVQGIGALSIGTGDLIGGDMDGMDGTAWQWLNSVTQFVDHEATAQTVSGRIDQAWFGKGDALKSRAFELVSQFADDAEVRAACQPNDHFKPVLEALLG